MQLALQNAFSAIEREMVQSPDPYTEAKAKAMMVGYDNRWRDHEWTTIESEVEYHLPLRNPETGSQSRTFTHAGKVDAIAEHMGRRVNVEHKTTSDEIEDFGSPYWRHKVIDSQVSQYNIASAQSGSMLWGTLYDVLRKPAIRPKQVADLDDDGLKIVLDSHGNRVFKKDKSPRQSADKKLGYVLQQRDETPVEYYERLCDELNGNLESYYQRRTIQRLDSELIEYAQDMWDISQDIIATRRRGHHRRSPGACRMYNSMCEYLPLCDGSDDIQSGNWKQRDTHSELDSITDGQNVLTHSRMTCFSMCQKKHFYRYEIGIERKYEEEKESLRLGTIIHSALEAWWDTYKKENDNGSSSTSPAANDVAGNYSAAQV